VIEGKWPLEADWLAQICTLGERSADALQRYFVSARERRDRQDALRD
jgi:hypothetical protein